MLFYIIMSADEGPGVRETNFRGEPWDDVLDGGKRPDTNNPETQFTAEDYAQLREGVKAFFARAEIDIPETADTDTLADIGVLLDPLYCIDPMKLWDFMTNELGVKPSVPENLREKTPAQLIAEGNEKELLSFLEAITSIK